LVWLHIWKLVYAIFSMDTPLDQNVIAGRRKKTLLIAGIIIIILASAFFVFRNSVTPNLKKSSITTSVVEIGSIDNTLTATGEVLPEFEEVITSPIDATIQKIALEAGANVKQGESVLALDKSVAENELATLKFQLESKRNDISELKLELDKSFYDIKSNNDIKQLKISSLEAEVENAKRLYKAGGGTREDIEQAELNLKVSKLEKQQLENEIKTKQQTMRVQMREAEIAAAIQQNNLAELERKLKKANIVASRDGVVTWVNKNIGASVHQGDALARIADLSSFSIQGSISDNFLDKLHVGIPAIVSVNDTKIRSTVSSIQPSIQNGIVTFNVRLDQKSNKLFRPNMKVDVYLVISSKNNVMRVANGPAFKGAAVQDIYVLKDGKKAERRTVSIGITSFDYVEIKGNVKSGDVVITSDMRANNNAKEITINE
jgi:HlyD family secretion protein